MIRILLACALLAGCASEDPAGVGDERFIDTMVELRRAAITAGVDTTAFARLRDSVLAEHGVTEADLRTYVHAHSADLEHMAAIWDSVSARLSEAGPL